MNLSDVLLPSFAALMLGGLVLFAYRHDIKDARLFAAIRRASEHPYADREFHRAFARSHGLFWSPCPSCSEPFGGHELSGKTIAHPDPERNARGERKSVCPPCAQGLRGHTTRPRHAKIMKSNDKHNARRAKKG